MKNSKYKVKKIRFLSFVLFLIIANTNQLTAQNTVPINLEKVLEWGGADNLTIKEYKERQKLSMAELAKAKEWWLPEFYAGIQTQQLWGAAMNADGRFFLDVNRQNLWGGLGLNANWDFADGIYNAKSANLRSQASQYVTQAERNQQLLKIIDAYYNLMTAQLNYDAYQKLLVQSDSIIQQIQIQVEGGLRYESELLLAKSNKNHLKVEMLNAKKAYHNASASLKKLLNIEQNVKLVSVDESLLPLDFTAELEAVEDSVYLNRPEIKANELQFQALEAERKKYTTALLIPELNIGTYASLFGRINGNVSPMTPAQYPETRQLYPTQALNVSLMWDIPLGALTYQGDKKSFDSKIRLNEIEADQINVQVNEEIANANSDLQLGKEQIETAKEGLDFTTEALNQSIERQKLGTAIPFEVFQAQQFFLQAQLDYLKSISAYNKAQYGLKVAKGEDL
ncbi:MAG: outer membrane protein TolC [Chitinophagales bacterium]|jgi:outer membrane protein TolC